MMEFHLFFERKNKIRLIYIFVFFMFVIKMLPEFFYVRAAIRDFCSSRGNYDLMRHRGPIFSVVFEADQVIPRKATFDMSRSQWEQPRVATRYFLYPREFSNDWSFYIDVDQKVNPSIKQWKRHILPSGAVIYAREGHEFVKYVKPAGYYSLIRLAAVVIFCVLINLLVGLLICLLLDIPFKEGERGYYLSTAYLLGFFILTGVIWLALLLGFLLSRTLIISVWCIILVLLLLKNKKKILYFANKFEIDFQSLRLLSSRSSNLFLNFLFVTFILSVAVAIALTPVYDWDSLSHWILKSKVLFYQQHLDFSYTHINFYPLLWPLHIAIQFIFLGQDYDAVASWMTSLMFIAFMLQLRAGLKILLVKEWHSLISIMLFFSLFFNSTFHMTKPENIFLAFQTASIVAILVWIREPNKRNYFYLSFIFISAMSLTKLEGAISSIIMGISLFLVYYKNFSWKQIINVYGFFIVPVFVILLWMLWVKINGGYVSVSHFQKGFSLEKVGALCVIVKNYLVTHRELFFIFILLSLLPLIILFRPIRLSEKFLVYIFCGLTFFSGIAILGWPSESLANMFEEASIRLFIHAAPAWVLCWASLLFSQEPPLV